MAEERQLAPATADEVVLEELDRSECLRLLAVLAAACPGHAGPCSCCSAGLAVPGDLPSELRLRPVRSLSAGLCK